MGKGKSKAMLGAAIVCSDSFRFDLSHDAQRLYVQLQFAADGFGVVDSLQGVCYGMGLKDGSAARELAQKGYLLFAGGLPVIRGWWVNNNHDKYNDVCSHKEIVDLLEQDENGYYQVKQSQTETRLIKDWNQTGTSLEADCGQTETRLEPGTKRIEGKSGKEREKDNLSCEYREGQPCPACGAGRLVPDDTGLMLYCEACGYVAKSSL